MSIYFSIEAESHEDFVAKLTAAYNGFCQPKSFGAVLAESVAAINGPQRDCTTASMIKDAAAEQLSTTLATMEGPKQQRRRGRPRKNETQEAAALAPAPETTVGDVPAGATAEAPAQDAADIPDFLKRDTAPAASVTKEQVKNALNAYVGTHSMPAGRELVQKVCGVDVLSLSQIPEDKYAAVVAACKAA